MNLKSNTHKIFPHIDCISHRIDIQITQKKKFLTSLKQTNTMIHKIHLVTSHKTKLTIKKYAVKHFDRHVHSIPKYSLRHCS